MRTQIIKQQFDKERALYNATATDIIECTFAGEADGESVLKEARDILVKDSTFSLRYPLWHVRTFEMTGSYMDEATRAAIWYSYDGQISDCKLYGIKAVRECERINIERCSINSPEFGWKSNKITLRDSEITSEYLFFDSRNVTLDKVHMKGKYSFQYIENLTITNSMLDTKDAFWHSKNVTVKDSIVKGEYLAWFSEDLTLINCHIQGTQPLCYCKNLKLINCTMDDADLAFEYSEVEADVKGHIISVKNPKKGSITADSVGDIIMEDAVMECNGKVIIRGSYV